MDEPEASLDELANAVIGEAIEVHRELNVRILAQGGIKRVIRSREG
ncbi:MAG: hypothetical protein AB7J35_13585 [Dehalococcoidia bacterium]